MSLGRFEEVVTAVLCPHHTHRLVLGMKTTLSSDWELWKLTHAYVCDS